jgi:ssDNA-binding Zn-finger/Zn-ribbon topoisomerase 1
MAGVDEKILKLCPQCGTEMWVVDVPQFGRLWICADCKIGLSGNRILPWRHQIEAPEEAPIDVRNMQPNRHKSTKPCPECGQPMWAIVEEGYGTRHQCEDCRLTVMFGGAISRWRKIRKDQKPEDLEAKPTK